MTAEKGHETKDAAHAARSGAVQFLTLAAQALLTVTHVVFARVYGRAVFGSYQASLAIVEILTRGGTGGADKGMLRYVAGHRARGEPDLVRSALGTGLRLCLVIAGGAAAALIATAGPVARMAQEPTLAVALRWLAPVAVFTGCMWVLVQASLAAKVMRANFLVRGLGEPTFIFAAGLAAAAFGPSLEHLAIAHTLASAATLLLAVVVVGRVFGKGELGRALRAPRLAGFVGFSIPLGTADLMNAVLQRADILLLTIFIGPSSAAVYAASEFITRVIANARYMFDSVAAPVFSEAVHLGQNARLRENLVLMTRWVATAAAPITVTVVILRGDLLSLYGPGFQEGSATLVILAIGHLINGTMGLGGWVLLVSGRSRLMLLNNTFVALVNVTMGLILIPRFGLVGTAFAALGSITMLHLLVTVEVRVIHGVYPFDWSTCKPFVAALVALAVEQALETHVSRRAIRISLVVAAGLGAYLTTLRMLGLAPEDRRLVGSAQRKLRGWLGACRPARHRRR